MENEEKSKATQEIAHLMGYGLILMGIGIILLNVFIVFTDFLYKWYIIGGIASLGILFIISGIVLLKMNHLPFIGKSFVDKIEEETK